MPGRVEVDDEAALGDGWCSCRRAPAASTGGSPAARSGTRGRGGTAAGGHHRARSARRSRRSAGTRAPGRPAGARRGDGRPVVVGAPPPPPSRGRRRRSRRARAASGQSSTTTSRRGLVRERWSSLMPHKPRRDPRQRSSPLLLTPASRPDVPPEQRPDLRGLLLGVVEVEGHPQPARPAPPRRSRARRGAAAPPRPRPGPGSPAPPARAPPRRRRRPRPAARGRAAPGTPTGSRRASEDAVPTHACHPGDTSNRRASEASRSGSPVDRRPGLLAGVPPRGGGDEALPPVRHAP